MEAEKIPTKNRCWNSHFIRRRRIHAIEFWLFNGSLNLTIAAIFHRGSTEILTKTLKVANAQAELVQNHKPNEFTQLKMNKRNTYLLCVTNQQQQQ